MARLDEGLYCAIRVKDLIREGRGVWYCGDAGAMCYKNQTQT